MWLQYLITALKVNVKRQQNERKQTISFNGFFKLFEFFRILCSAILQMQAMDMQLCMWK